MKVLITGCVGFIGYNLTKLLLDQKIKVVGVDNFDTRTGKKLKKDRYKDLRNHKNIKFFKFYKIDISNKSQVDSLFRKHKFKKIIHLAALAGVRNSFLIPEKYINVNIIGSFNIFENAKNYKDTHLIIASTSSVYGMKKTFPIKEHHNTDLPLSLYAATKKSMEVISHVYAHNFNLNVTVLRFFTVYGPFGRPDMALYKFAKCSYDNKPIPLFNKGRHTRDFTYVSDIAFAIKTLVVSNKKLKKFDVYNLSNGKAIPLKRYIKEIEKNLKTKLKRKLLSLQRGDVHKTHGSNLKFKKHFSFKPKTNVNLGIKNFINWFKSYHKKNK